MTSTAANTVDAAIDNPGGEIPTLLERSRIKANRIAARIKNRLGRALHELFAIGRDLEEARLVLSGRNPDLPHDGEWLRWLREDVRMSEMQALRLIRVWKEYGEPGLTTSLAHVPFNVLAELAAPEANPEVVADFEARIASGEQPTVREGVDAKQAAKAKKAKASAPKPEPKAAPTQEEDTARTFNALIECWEKATQDARGEFVRQYVQQFCASEIERQVAEQKKRCDEGFESQEIERARLAAVEARLHRFMTQDEYRLILGCLHADKPDRDPERLNKAFNIMRRLEPHVKKAATLAELREHGWYKDIPNFGDIPPKARRRAR